MYISPLASQKTLFTAAKLYEIHGDNLFTIILPTLGKALDRALSGSIFSYPQGLLKKKKDRSYPVFMSEFFSNVIDKHGYIISDRAPNIRFLRTLLYLYYKYETPFTDSQLVDAVTKFRDTDSNVKTTIIGCIDYEHVSKNFKALLPDDPYDIRPRHSGGATADRYNNIQKRDITRFIPSLHTVFDVTKYFFNANLAYSKEYFADNLVVVEPSARVTFVPKDSRGPRTICMEPHERMYVQKGLMHKIYEHIECYSHASGKINFSDQDVNKMLAYKSSYDRKYATIDLKDASDLVSWYIIQSMCTPEYARVLQALRTPVATLPDGTNVNMLKYAPMGSALCFPIEAIFFYAIVSTLTDDVYVYGDDIIVPLQHFESAVERLESYGLKVNADKSLCQGFFRESCGGDYYKSHNITPIRYRRDDHVSVVAFANNLAEAFGTKYGEAVIELFESIGNPIVPRLPFRYKESGAICFYTHGADNLILFRRRWNKDLQVYEYRLPTVTTDIKRKANDSYGSYIDWLSISNRSNSPTDDANYEDNYGRENAYHKIFDYPSDKRTHVTRDRVTWKWATER